MNYFVERERLEAEQSLGQRASDGATGHHNHVPPNHEHCSLCYGQGKRDGFQAGLAAAAKHRMVGQEYGGMGSPVAYYTCAGHDCDWDSRSGQSWADHIRELSLPPK